MTLSLQRVLRALVVAVYGGLWLLTVAAVAQFWRNSGHGGSYDALSYYVAGRLAAGGQAGVLYDLARQHALALALAGESLASSNWPFVYPPWVALVCIPLARLPYPVAYAGFVALQVVPLLGAAERLARLLPAGDRRPLLGLAAGTPLVVLLGQPQWSAWALWGLSGALVAQRDGRGAGRVGAWLLLGLVKPSLLLPPLLWLLVTRQWRALGLPAAGGGGLSLASALVLGPWWTPWLQALAGQDQQAADLRAMPTLRGLLALGGWEPGLLVLALLGGGLTVAALYGASPAARPLVALTAGWLLLPHAYSHDMILLAAPGALVWTQWPRARPLLVPAPALTWLAPFVPNALFSLPLIAAVGLAWAARGRRAAPAAGPGAHSAGDGGVV